MTTRIAANLIGQSFLDYTDGKMTRKDFITYMGFVKAQITDKTDRGTRKSYKNMTLREKLEILPKEKKEEA